jgi:hypothetical protein
MVHELYNILSIFVTSGLFLAFGLMFLSQPYNSPLLNNYHKARYAMAGAYLFFVAVEITKYLFGDLSGHNVALLQAVSLTISASQSFLFTFAMLALVEVRFPGWRYIFREAAPALLLITAVFMVYAFCSEACFRIAFYGFAGIYALLLVRYTFLFVKNYRLLRYRPHRVFRQKPFPPPVQRTNRRIPNGMAKAGTYIIFSRLDTAKFLF